MSKIKLLFPLLWLSTYVFPQDSCKSKEYLIDSIMKTHIIPSGKNPVYNFLLYANNYSSGCEIKKGFGTVGRNENAIEQITHKKLHEVIRERIITPLNLKNTYFEFYEPEQGNLKRIDAFLNKINITEKINTSYEWAGGGIVSTTQELAIFITALFSGNLFAKNGTLDKMTDISRTKKFGANYGLGLIRYEVGKYIFYGHGGFYGSIMLYDPLNHFVFCANIGQAIPPYDSGELAKNMIRILLN